jgi:8-oxo-dGTP pyrophosphatase MutT (NUDIX family)
MGAGMIPFALDQGQAVFLFQTVFSGRKTGFLNDFGGGLGSDESYRQAALREFVEETETMYLCDDLDQAARSTERIERQVRLLDGYFERTMQRHPHWWCRRHSDNPLRPKDWRSFFVQLPHRQLDPLNRAWREDRSGRFKKRRELFWVTADELLDIYRNQPQRLWRRVRQLQGAEAVVEDIQRALVAGELRAC